MSDNSLPRATTSKSKKDYLLVASQLNSQLYRAENGLEMSPSTEKRLEGHLVVERMQVPFGYAEDIIGVRGANIDYIRRSSGAFLNVQGSKGLPDEMTVEIKGKPSQVEAAKQLIQGFIN